MEKLVQRARRRGVRARHVHRAASGPAPCRTIREEIAFLPAHRLSALHQGAEDHVDAADEDLSRSHQAARSDAALRRDDHGGAGAGRGGAGRRGDRGGQVSRAAARHSVRREGSLRHEGRAHDVGLGGFRESRHRRGRRSRRAAARCRRGADGEARDRDCSRRAISGIAAARTTRGIISPRLERIVGGSGVGDGGGMRRVRHRHGDVGLDRVAGDASAG